ncbi:MAG: hypothetical protein GXY06_04220 [Clostridiaceae bacterium]|nr:hypothetical protein [Clostridiaceae bacterium]
MRRNRNDRFHKRPFVVAAIVLSTFLVVGIGFITYMGVFSRHAGFERIRVSNISSGDLVHGVGLNLVDIPTGNYIKNASFENVASDQVFVVHEGRENYAYLMMDASQTGMYKDGDFIGGTVRVMALDENGQYIQKMQSVVEAFQINQIGVWRELLSIDPLEIDNIVSVRSSASVSVAFSSQGKILAGIGSAETLILDLNTGSELTATSAVGSRFSSVYDGGVIATSSDGKNFNSFFPDVPFEERLNTLTSIDRVVVAAGESGALAVLSDGKVSRLTNLGDKDIRASASDGSVMILAGEEGALYTSSNGLLFRPVNAAEMPDISSLPNWACAAYGKDRFVLVADDGLAWVGSYTDKGSKFSFSEVNSSSDKIQEQVPKEVVVDQSGEVMLLTGAGQIFVLDSINAIWKEASVPTGAKAECFYSIPGGKVLIYSDRRIYTASLLLKIQFSDTLSDTELKNGDMCYINGFVPAFGEEYSDGASGGWEVFGSNTSVMSVEDAPTVGGQTSIKISGGVTEEADNYRILSQVISQEAKDVFMSGAFYRADVWLKQEGVENDQVMLWLSGDFESIGTTFTDVGSGWRKYSFRFVIPSEVNTKSDEPIRFNIGFFGSGTLYVDRAYLGRDTYDGDSIPSEYRDRIVNMAPTYLRMSQMVIGDRDSSMERYLLPIGNESSQFDGTMWQSNGCESLESALMLSKESGAYPWFVIDSYADQSDIDMMMSYLCGSLTDPIGKIRVNNGTAVAWISQFDRIVFEVSDKSGVFTSDLQRRAYVDYIIGQFIASNYFMDIKDKVIFLDGMSYDGGIMTSIADYHTSTMISDNRLSLGLSLSYKEREQLVNASYVDYYDSIPRITSRPYDTGGEWVGSSMLRYRIQTNTEDLEYREYIEMNSAEFANFLLWDLGQYTSCIAVDLDASMNPYDLGTDELFKDHLEDDSFVAAVHDNSILRMRVLEAIMPYAKGSLGEVSINPSLKEVALLEESSEYVPSYESKNDGLNAYSFVNENSITIIVTNISDRPRSVTYIPDFSYSSVHVEKYAEDGKLLASYQPGKRNTGLTLPPGQIFVIRFTVKLES